MLEIGRRVGAATVVDFHSGNLGLYDDAPVASVARGICAVITKQIVSRRVLLNALENLAEIVGIEKRFPAGIAGQRDQGLLGGEIGVQRIERRLSGIGRDAAQA